MRRNVMMSEAMMGEVGGGGGRVIGVVRFGL